MMERRLVLIKHSHPQVEPHVTAAEWHLSEVGQARCALLAERLRSYDIQVLVASPESKAIETAELVGERLGLPSFTVLSLPDLRLVETVG